MKRFIVKFQMFLFLAILSSCGNSGKGNVQEKDPTDIEISQPIKPTVNVYIENSSSIDGYVEGVTQFEQTIFSYLTDIKISGLVDTMNLFYINSKVLPYSGDGLSGFIENLDRGTFIARGGDRGTTEISDIINSVLLNTGENDVSILVTDGIFSPGGKNAQEYLRNQQIRIRDFMKSHLDNFPGTAIIIYKLSSNFNGTYYNRVDGGIGINEPRPYYMWVIGNIQHIENLLSPTRRIINEVENTFSITLGERDVDYAIKPNSGNFELDHSNPKRVITRLRRDIHTGRINFSIDANLSGFLLDDNYLLDPGNYVLNNSNYSFQVKRSVINSHGYTHTFDFSSENVHRGMVSIQLKNEIPQWVEDINDDEGITAVSGKTFGIKHQIFGLFEAFTFNNNNYTEIIINID